MVSSAATSVEQYLRDLPPERRAVVARVRDLVRASLPAGYEEGMGFGMIVWSIPLARYPDTYNGQPLGYAALAAQKHYYALYLTGTYMGEEHMAAFARAFAQAGKRLDMGKSCLRFKALEDLPLDVLAREVARVSPDELIALYERSRAESAGGSKAKAKTSKSTPTKAKTSKPAPAKTGADASATSAKTASRKTTTQTTKKTKTTKSTTKSATKQATKTAAKKATGAAAGRPAAARRRTTGS